MKTYLLVQTGLHSGRFQGEVCDAQTQTHSINSPQRNDPEPPSVCKRRSVDLYPKFDLRSYMFVYWMRFSPRTYSDIIFFEWPLMADFCPS